jgi:hypothetical protein
MRTLLLPVVLAMAPVVQANELLVVVYSTDTRVVDHVCMDQLQDGITFPVVQRVVQKAGQVNYRVLGGMPPYVLLNDVRDEFGNVCLTFRDAAGTVAKGCTVIGQLRSVQMMNCAGSPPYLNDVMLTRYVPAPYVPAPNHRSPAKPPVPDPDRPSKDEPVREDRPVRGRQTGRIHAGTRPNEARPTPEPNRERTEYRGRTQEPATTGGSPNSRPTGTSRAAGLTSY